jgi:predicted nucleic acid binding AN1-type Zn finger protein
MFHKVQDSFIVDYKDIERRELTTKDGLSFKAGPYYIHPQDSKNTVKDLAKASELLSSDNGDGIKSGIRNWVSLRIEDKNKAEQRKNRMLDIFAEGSVIKTLTCEDGNRCIAYDVLAYHTIMNQETNE